MHPRRLQAVADDLTELVPREGAVIAVPTDITSSDEVGKLAERCVACRLLCPLMHACTAVMPASILCAPAFIFLL